MKRMVYCAAIALGAFGAHAHAADSRSVTGGRFSLDIASHNQGSVQSFDPSGNRADNAATATLPSGMATAGDNALDQPKAEMPNVQTPAISQSQAQKEKFKKMPLGKASGH